MVHTFMLFLRKRTGTLHTITHVTPLAARQRVLAAAGTGMNRHRLSDDQSILHQLSDLLACGTDLQRIKICWPLKITWHEYTESAPK